MSAETTKQADCEYIVVGSGAGGGPVAANLAEAGHKVLLLEAGGDPLQLPDSRLPEDYHVPAFHAFASENEALKWDFFVRHYANDQQQSQDPKFRATHDGVLYPRAGALGGCTAHNAMIMVYPHNADWEYIAELMGDASWKAGNMHKYFQRLETCRYRPIFYWLEKIFGINPTGHGFNGWLSAERAFPKALLEDHDLKSLLIKSALEAAEELDRYPLKRILSLLESEGDPNDWRSIRANAVGIRHPPLTTYKCVRVGTRERLLEVARKHPDKLRIELNALAIRVILDNERRATGIEYLKGERLYRAHSSPSSATGERCEAFASREIILSGGAFNTPQLLMLSGIGPRDVLEDPRINIPVQVELPGVGRNLQDRYEVSVVNRMKHDWQILAGAAFEKGDPQYQEWSAFHTGVYATNGGLFVVIKKSAQAPKLPDLFCLGLLARFEGYFPKYSKLIAKHHNYLSWVVLKAHTGNTAGTVTLRSADPRDTPLVNFHYFNEGSDDWLKDLDAVVDGIQFVREMTVGVSEYVDEEELPGKKNRSRDELRQFVKDNAWGHHASCSCAIGPREKNGVVDSKFRVHGTKGLRIVDASVFPKIPGFFIVSSVYMIAEKASDVILADV